MIKKIENHRLKVIIKIVTENFQEIRERYGAEGKKNHMENKTCHIKL